MSDVSLAAKEGGHTCAHDRYCASLMNIAPYRSDFETCWQSIADYKEAPFVNSRRDVIEPCVGEGHAKVFCVHAVHEMPKLPATVLA